MEQPAVTPSAKRSEYSSGDRPPLWRHWGFVSLLVLLSSAILGIAGFLGYYQMGGYGERYSLVLPLQLSQGEGQSVGDSLQIQRLSPQGRAFVAAPIMPLPVETFSVLEWRIDGLNPGTEVLFAWITSAAPRQTRSLPITDTTSGKGELRLHSHPHWNQTILAVGLVVRGTLAEPLTIHRLALKPDSPSAIALLEQLWSEWIAFEGWRGHSINFIIGGARLDRLVSPILAIAAWVSLSALFYVGLVLGRWQNWSIKPFILFFFAGWVVLDSRWQLDLWRQLEITQEKFAGKSYEEKRLAADDAELFKFAQAIKGHLEEESARILVITPTLGDDFYYRRVRMNYFLLPFNVSAQWTKPPPPTQARSGDYLLFLYPVHNVTFHAPSQTLRWENDNELTVKPVFNSQLGALFHIR